MSGKKKALLGAVGVVLALGIFGWVTYSGGQHEGPGQVHGAALPQAQVQARNTRQASARPKGRDKQILFGDLHVHSTFSMDAFFISLPLLSGEGAHPPADACDFARYCAQLDFFSINDHAEGITPAHWQETKDSIRECNEVAGDPKNPDLVAFVGWEWTQVGSTPEKHYGHKNVILRDLDEAKLPSRPIASIGVATRMRNAGRPPLSMVLSTPILEWSERQRYLDLATFTREIADTPACPEGVDVRKLPSDCIESAATPAELFEKLDQWGFDTLVIPHGTTWGMYTPPGYSWDKQLDPKQHDPEKQSLIEVFSGHGNSEEYRSYRAGNPDGKGGLSCPEPSADYEPCCWRAGEIVRASCADKSSKECEAQVAEARQNYLDAGMSGFTTQPFAEVAEWGDCGVCRDCYLPSFAHRPRGSAQYILAKGHFEAGKPPAYAPMGFIASSDNHTARPGTGYKETRRYHFTEAAGPKSKAWRDKLQAMAIEAVGAAEPGKSYALTDEMRKKLPPFALAHFERQASFFLTGGLVAVHSEGRSRERIWDALKRREVYGTSGERILLWFDLVEEGGELTPMGSDLKLGHTPRFRVRAVGSFQQQPGCPDAVTKELPAAEIERICRGECYNPGDARHRITHIEVVRIRPQKSADEPVAELIEDVWLKKACPASGDVCEVEFDDPAFLEQQRDVIYYVRALQAPTPTVNAANVRCERDDQGNCTKANPCYGDYRTPREDDCLSDAAERAWSSPIFLRYDAAAAAAAAETSADAGADGGAASDAGSP